MVTTLDARPFVIHEVVDTKARRSRAVGRYEVRPVRLRIMASMLGLTVADLDVVRDARVLADIHHCPACGPGPRRAA